MCIDGYLDSVSDVFHVDTYMHIHKQREKIRVSTSRLLSGVCPGPLNEVAGRVCLVIQTANFLIDPDMLTSATEQLHNVLGHHTNNEGDIIDLPSFFWNEENKTPSNMSDFKTKW